MQKHLHSYLPKTCICNYMKNLFIVSVILFVTLSCGKNNDPNQNVPRIVIKGTLSGSNLKGSSAKSANSLSLTDAKKVLVFNSTSYKVFDIVNNSFTVANRLHL